MDNLHIDTTLYHGRPDDPAGRTSGELACYDTLDALGIDYMRMDHDPTDSMEVCREVECYLGVDICKNLFLCNRQETDFYLLVMEGDKPFKTKYLSKILGCSRLSFANPAFMAAYLGVTPGSVSVLGLQNDREQHVRLLIDRPVTEKTFFGCHPCINTSSLRVRLADILEVFLPHTGHAATVIDLPSELEEGMCK